MTERQIVLTAAEYTRQLRSFQSDDELRKIQRYFKARDDDHVIGVRMLHVFTLAKVFIDLAAPNVIGDYLLGRPRGILYDLAGSDNPWERRTAIYSTLAFVRKGDVTDTIGIARILVDDPHDLVQKPTGSSRLCARTMWVLVSRAAHQLAFSLT